MNLKDTPAPRYDADFALWLESQLQLLRAHQFDKLDLENLLEELGGILSCQRNELKSRLEIIVVHLLKCQFQPERKGKSWRSTLWTQRSHITILLEDSPNLRRFVLEYANNRYRHAVGLAVIETGLPAALFPKALPYSEEQLLNSDFVP